MKNKYLLLSFCLLSGASFASAQTIAQWTFDSNTTTAISTEGLTTSVDLANSSVVTGIAADVGSGTASGFHASASTTWSTPAGNGVSSANSLSSNNWAVGDYYQFQVDGTGYSAFTFSWDQTGSNTGPKDFTLSYSTNGTDFTNVYSYSVANTSWNATSESASTADNYSYTAQLSQTVTGTFYFRFTDASTTSINNGTVASGGTGRIDNIVIGVASAVPEPSTYAAILGGLALVAVIAQRRRQSTAKRS